MDVPQSNATYKSDVPVTVQQQIQLFYQQEEQILKLEAALGKLRREHTDLKVALSPYRIQNDVVDAMSIRNDEDHTPLEQTEPSPFDRCPDEIFFLIFEAYLDLLFNRSQIGRLLLVCRRWHGIVMDRAALWSRIEIPSWEVLFNLSARKTEVPFLSTCLSRSKNMSLDMTIDLGSLSSSNYIAEELCCLATSITDEVAHDTITDHIYTEDWEYSSSHYMTQLHQALGRLIGNEGEHVKRWKTLDITLPINGESCAMVWSAIAPSFGALDLVIINNYPEKTETLQPVSGPISIRQLRFHTINFTGRVPITTLNVVPADLEHLTIDTDDTLYNLRTLSSFCRLHTLSITSNIHTALIQAGKIKDISVSLPRLNKLTLGGCYALLEFLQFDLPSLDWLHLHPRDPSCKLPKLSPQRIYWKKANWRPLKRNDLEKQVLDVLLLSDSTQSISIQHSDRETFKRLVEKCKAEGKTSSLTQLIVELRGGEIERVDV